MLSEPEHQKWRNDLLDKITGPALQAIVAFGGQAREAVKQWPNATGLPVFDVPHPSSRNATTLVNEWRDAIDQLRTIITPDPDGDPTGPNYGPKFREADYARIPPGDLPFGVPAWLGDDAWGRAAKPRHNNSVERPSSDLRHTLIWRAPENQS
jgi:hypothetical protein